MKYLFLNNVNIDSCLKDKYQILAYRFNNTYAKLAPDSILNKKVKEVMRYTGDTRHPL